MAGERAIGAVGARRYVEIRLREPIEGDDPSDRVMTDSFTDDKYLIERDGQDVRISFLDGGGAFEVPWASVKKATVRRG